MHNECPTTQAKLFVLIFLLIPIVAFKFLVLGVDDRESNRLQKGHV